MTDLLKIADLMERLKISRSTLATLRRTGRFPKPVNVGHALRWRGEDIEGWISANRKGRA